MGGLKLRGSKAVALAHGVKLAGFVLDADAAGVTTAFLDRAVRVVLAVVIFAAVSQVRHAAVFVAGVAKRTGGSGTTGLVVRAAHVGFRHAAIAIVGIITAYLSRARRAASLQQQRRWQRNHQQSTD